MKVDLALFGSRVVLVPYRPRHVPKYHGWMQDDLLLSQTASERLSLEEEYENCESWHKDEKKLTFIILSRKECVNGDYPLEAMAGDVNCFFNEDGAELEIMIAEKRFRRQGFALEALDMIMDFVGPGRRFYAKIGADNVESQKLFVDKAGFVQVGFVEAFQEYEYEAPTTRTRRSHSTRSFYNDDSSRDLTKKKKPPFFLRQTFRVSAEDYDEGKTSPDEGSSYAVSVLYYGRKAAFVWVGRSSAKLGSVALSAPASFEHGEPAVTSLIGDASEHGNITQRLSKKTKRMIMLAWNVQDDDVLVARRIELEVAGRLLPAGYLPLLDDEVSSR